MSPETESRTSCFLDFKKSVGRVLSALLTTLALSVLVQYTDDAYDTFVDAGA